MRQKACLVLIIVKSFFSMIESSKPKKTKWLSIFSKNVYFKVSPKLWAYKMILLTDFDTNIYVTWKIDTIMEEEIRFCNEYPKNFINFKWTTW